MQSSSALSRTCCARCTWPNNLTSISWLLSCIESSAISVLEMHGCVRLAPGFHPPIALSVAASAKVRRNALAANGTEPLVLAVPLSIDEAAAGYLAGTLVTTHERVCLYG